MANEEHLRILKQGTAVWNQWRQEYSDEKPDLSYTSLKQMDLTEVDLSYANLRRSTLTEVNLSYADLRRANLSRTNFIGIHLNNAYLTEANLFEAYLSNADITVGDLRGADLSKAILRRADLRRADLSHAYFINANLINTDFSYTNLRHSILIGADLSHANFTEANLSHTNLSGANLEKAIIGWTMFGNSDLSETRGLETVEHRGPSTNGIDTIYRSKGGIPYKFLLDAGISQADIGYLLSLAGKAIDFYSCFISYSTKDQEFAERLHADLKAKGVPCWFAPHTLKPGEVIVSAIDNAIRLYDKLLLILSEAAVESNWVQHEVESALTEEVAKRRQMLFPIRLDNAVMEAGDSWAHRIREKRHISDFTQWKDHDIYQKALQRLLRDLKAAPQK